MSGRLLSVSKTLERKDLRAALAKALPARFSKRTCGKLSEQFANSRGAVRGWLVVIVAAGTAFALLAIARVGSPARPPLKSDHSQPAVGLPGGLVAVNPEGKTFHVATCRYLHGKTELVSAESAVRNGYTPCVRCLSDMLRSKPRVAGSGISRRPASRPYRSAGLFL